MKLIKIEWLSDYSDCDQAGCSGGSADGFHATLDGEFLAEFLPMAHCYDSVSCDEYEAYKLILEALGHNIYCDEVSEYIKFLNNLGYEVEPCYG